MLVSVVIPAYKAEAYIEATIKSVLAQSHRKLEVWVIDDGSPDDLGTIVKRLAETDERLHYYRQANAGVAAARNKGYELAEGHFIAFLDADDIWLPNNLELKLDRLLTEPHWGLVHSDAEVIDAQGRPTGQIKQGKEGELLEDLLLWRGTCIPTPGSILMYRHVVTEVGGFDTRLSNAADQEFFFRVAARYPIARIPQVTWQYRVHGQNMHSNIALMEKDALQAYACAEAHELFKSECFRRLCFARMYLIVGASWWGDGGNKGRGLYFALRALLTYPPAVWARLTRKNF